MKKYTPTISDEKVKDATGKTWKEWFVLLNKLGAKKLTHKDIAMLLYTKKYIKSGWWCQMVTVEYEKAHGLRVLGKTKDAGFEIGVQKTFPVTPTAAWTLMTSPKGQAVWLGKSSRKMNWKKGNAYTTANGIVGEVRSVTPGEKLRLTYQPRTWKQSSTVQVYILPTKNPKKTAIQFHQEKLPSAKHRTQMKAHWQQVLKKLSTLTA